MQIVISKSLFTRAAAFERKLSLVSQALAIATGKAMDIKIESESWGSIVEKLIAAGGKKEKDGASVSFVKASSKMYMVKEDSLLVEIDDELIIEAVDAWEEFAMDLIPVIVGFVTSIKALARAYENRIKAIQAKWKTKKAKAAK